MCGYIYLYSCLCTCTRIYTYIWDSRARVQQWSSSALQGACCHLISYCWSVPEEATSVDTPTCTDSHPSRLWLSHGHEVKLKFVIICISLFPDWTTTLHMAVHISSSVCCLDTPFALVYIEYFSFSFLNSYYQDYVENFFSQFMTWLYSLYIVSFEKWKFLFIMELHLSIISFRIYTFRVLFINDFPSQIHKNIVLQQPLKALLSTH